MLAFISQNCPLSQTQIKSAESKANADKNVQNCRRDVLTNPQKYTEDYPLGINYVSVVDTKTKEFINLIISRSY